MHIYLGGVAQHCGKSNNFGAKEIQVQIPALLFFNCVTLRNILSSN